MSAPAEDPILNLQSSLPERLLPQKAETRFDAALADWARWFGRTESEIQLSIFSVYQRSRETLAGWVTELQDQSRRIREERPLTLLGIIAGSAFAVGVGIALRKSRRS